MDYNIFDDLQLIVNLKGNIKMVLECSCIESNGNITNYCFEDTEKAVSVVLEVENRENIYFIRINAETKVEQTYIRQLFFEEENALEIVFKTLKEADESLSFYHFNDWWTRASFERKLTNLQSRTSNILIKQENKYFYLYPVVDAIYKADISGDELGLKLNLSSFKGGIKKVNTLACVIGYCEKNPKHLFTTTISSALEALKYKTKLREEKEYPQVLEKLGWCTWDAFYGEVSEEKILLKFEEFKQKQIPIKWIIIDDGWLDEQDKELVSFAPNKNKFPNGFKYLVDRLKKEYGVEHVGVWHTFFGYWNGIKKDSSLYEEFKDSLYETVDGRVIPFPDEDRGFVFWDAWHTYLENEGIDLVKVDGQSSLNNYTMFNESIGKAAAGAHKALEKSVEKHFNNTMINCMGMASENILSRGITAVSRNSDDFMPDNRMPFSEHLMQNAYNSLYHGLIYYLDFDMFWTKHEYAVHHAVLRALSGGPIYFSDGIGNSDMQAVLPTVLKSGEILRADASPSVTEDILFKNPCVDGVILKLVNKVSDSVVIGAFNIDTEGRTIESSINTTEFDSLSTDKLIIYRYFSKDVITLEKGEVYNFVLKTNEIELFTILPYNNDFAIVGLLDKYLPRATISDIVYSHNYIKIELKESGDFGIVLDNEPNEIKINSVRASNYVKKGNFYIIKTAESKDSGKNIVEITF